MESEKIWGQIGLGFAAKIWLCLAETWDGSLQRLLNQREGEYSYFLLTEIIFKQLLLLTLRLYFKIIILKSLILKTGLFHNSLFTLMNSLEREKLASSLSQKIYYGSTNSTYWFSNRINCFGKENSSDLLYTHTSLRQKGRWMRWSINTDRKPISWITLD